jgi:hypothetical protein
MTYLEGLNKVIEAMGERELDQNAQQTTYLGLIAMQLAMIADELARMNGSVKSEVHCACTDEEISKSFMEDVSAVEEQLFKQTNDKIIHVGDEIYSELTDCKAVVQRIDCWDRYECFTDNGSQFIIDEETFNDYWVKTGKNYPQITEILKQMKEGK